MEELVPGKSGAQMTLIINQNYLISKFFLKNQTNTCHSNTFCYPLVTHDTFTLGHLSSTSSLPHHQNLFVLSTISIRLYETSEYAR